MTFTLTGAIAAKEPFAYLQDRLVGLAGIMENIALEKKSVMVNERESSCCADHIHYHFVPMRI